LPYILDVLDISSVRNVAMPLTENTDEELFPPVNPLFTILPRIGLFAINPGLQHPPEQINLVKLQPNQL
jgi:hypothetical protein